MTILQILKKKPAKSVHEVPTDSLQDVFSQAAFEEHEKEVTIESNEVKGDIAKAVTAQGIADFVEVSTEVGEAVNEKKLKEP